MRFDIRQLNFYNILQYAIGLAILTLFLLPIRNASVLLTSISLICFLYNIIFRFKFEFTDFKYLLLFTIILFISFLYNDNLSISGQKKMETYLSFIAMWVISNFFNSGFICKNFHRIFICLSVIILLVFAYFISQACFRHYFSESYSEFYYFKLVEPFVLHPIYISVLIEFCIIHLIYYFKYLKISIYFSLLILILLNIILLLLSSKTIIVIHIIILLYLLFQLKSSRKILIASLSLGLLIAAIMSSELIKNRFIELYNLEALSILKHEKNVDWKNVNGLTLRLYLQKNALKNLIDSNVLFTGFGAGNSISVLNRMNESLALAITYPNGKIEGLYNYNLHNQYLQVLYNFGIISLILFCVLIVHLYKLSESNKSLRLSLIVLIIAFLTECYLETFRGIVYFMFLFILIIKLKDDKIAL